MDTGGLGSAMVGVWKQWEGQVVDGKYPLREYLGGSGQSAVFLTERGDAETQKAVVKLVPVEPDKARWELSRAEEAAKLSHPRLIRIFEAGLCRHDDLRLLYLVMEYAPEDLSQVLVQRPLTPEEAHEVLASVLEGLRYLHQEGFVHGHLKPANILAVEDQVKIAGDGLCRIWLSGQRKPGAYEAPRAGRQALGPAADVWDLGMTMVEVLTLRLPVWEGAERRLVLPENLPDPFLDIARHCLQEDPQRRWTLQQITERLAGQRTGTGPRLIPAKRRLILPLAAALGLAAVTAGFLSRSPSAVQNVSRAPEPPKQAPVAVEPKPAAAAAPEEARPSPFPVKKRPGPTLVAGAVTQTSPAVNVVPETVLAPKPVAGTASEAGVHQVLPPVPAKARNTIHGKVSVGIQVEVDTSGKVVAAHVNSPGTSPYFERLALDAARNWRFAPAQEDRNTAGAWLVRFEFNRSGTKVHSKRVSP